MGRTKRDTILGWCLAKPGTVEDYPFGDDVAVIHSYDLVVAALPKRICEAL